MEIALMLGTIAFVVPMTLVVFITFYRRSLGVRLAGYLVVLVATGYLATTGALTDLGLGIVGLLKAFGVEF